MSKLLTLAAAAAFSVATLAATAPSADARSMGGSMGGSKGSFSSKSSSPKSFSLKSSSSTKVIHKDHDRRRGHYYYAGAPVVYAAYSSCYWLKQRALDTGSPRWWARYEACRDGE